MAKRRRRGKYKTRPVKPQQPEAAPDDPALQSQQVDDAAAAPTAPVAPVAPLTGIPSTGMPIAAALGQQLPADNSVPEDQGYARGGLIPAPMPGFSDYTEMKTDPVARRKYSPKHVGFAKGGEVDDPMDYVPDQPQGRPQQQPSRFDEFNMIGRQPQTFNPALAAGETGYATGGPIAAAQVPAYAAPVYPAPSEANARLYSAMDALRERTANPPRLQMPAAPASASAAAPVQPPPLFGRAPGQAGPYNRWTFAEGGEVPPPQSAPDAQGYLNGDNAMDPRELDAVLQQIARLDPSKGEDAVNLTAIVRAAQSGNMDQAASILAGFRRRFDRLNAHAQGAAAHGDMTTAAALAGKAHSQVPDGMTINYAVAPDGSVTATVSPSGQTFQMSAAQFHDYLVGPGTSFDHILENGLDKNLAIASGGQGAAGQTGFAAGGAGPTPGQPQPAGPPPGPPPAPGPAAAGPPPPEEPTGYAEGGEVNEYGSPVGSYEGGGSEGNPDVMESIEADIGMDKPTKKQKARAQTSILSSGMGYAEGGEVTDDERQRQEAARAAADAAKQEQQAVKDTLAHTRQSYNLIEPAGGETALARGIGFPSSWGPQPPTRSEVEVESATPAVQTQEPKTVSPGAEDWERRKEQVKQGIQDLPSRVGRAIREALRDEPGTTRRGGSTAASLRDQPAPEDVSGVTADEAQRTAGAREQRAPQQADKPTITEAEWQDYLAQQKPAAAAETTGAGAGGDRTGYFRPTDDPNDPWSRPAGVMGQAEIAPVDRRITTKSILPLQGTSATSTRSPLDMYVTGPERSFYDAQGNRAPVSEAGWRLGASPYDVGPFSTRAVPMPVTPAPQRTYPFITRGGQVVDVPYERTGEGPQTTGFIGGAYKPETVSRGYIGGPEVPGPQERPTYTGPQGEERTGPNTAVAPYTRGPNGEIIPTQATLDAAQARGGRAPPGYPESRGAYPPELAAPAYGGTNVPRATAPAGPAAVNPAYAQEPFAGGVQETGQPLPTTSQRDQEAAQRSAQRVAVPTWAPQGSTVEQVQDGRAIARSPDGKIISINGDRVVRDKAGTILNPSGGAPPAPKAPQQAQQPQQPQVPKPPSSFYNLGPEPGIPTPKYQGNKLMNAPDIQQAQHQWTAWNHEQQAVRRMDAEWHTKQQQAIADMTPAQLIANHGHLLRTLPQLSEEDVRSARPILDALREQMTRRGIAPPPQAAPAAPAKGGGSWWPFGGGGNTAPAAPRMGRLPDGSMVQVD